MQRRGLHIVLTLALLVPSHFAFAATSCATPRTYSVRTVDDRFGIAKADVVQALARAEAVWEIPAQKNLFAYATSSGAVNVDFVYDSRQANVDKQKSTHAALEAIKTAFDSIRAQFAHEASSTEMQVSQNSSDFAAYNADVALFNADVVAANARGGATSTEYQLLTDRSVALNARFTTLKAREVILNDRIGRINTLSHLLNQLAAAINAYVARYNTTIASTGEFKEGLYEQSGASRTITIYEFSDVDQLVRVLAHEMGHALGLNHVPDSAAIMYETNEGTALTATKADITELDKVCGF